MTEHMGERVLVRDRKTKKPLLVVAKRNQVDRLKRDTKTLLAAIGHPEAFVTDDSAISDFGLTAAKLLSVSKKLGIKVRRDMYVHEVAALLAQMKPKCQDCGLPKELEQDCCQECWKLRNEDTEKYFAEREK